MVPRQVRQVAQVSNTAGVDDLASVTGCQQAGCHRVMRCLTGPGAQHQNRGVWFDLADGVVTDDFLAHLDTVARLHAEQTGRQHRRWLVGGISPAYQGNVKFKVVELINGG